MNRCGCNIDSGFSVGGDTIQEHLYLKGLNDIYDKLTNEFEELKTMGLELEEDLIELINYPNDVGNDELSEKIRTMINKLDQYEKKRLFDVIQELHQDQEQNLNPFEGQAE